MIIFCIWIVAIVAAVNIFMPSIDTAIAGINSYRNTANDTDLRKQMLLDDDKSYTSMTPLGVFDYIR